MIPAEITARRSIRRYTAEPVARADIEAVLEAGRLAPSSKNRQPWRFVVVQGAAKAELIRTLEAGLTQEAATPLLPGSAQYHAGAVQTFAVMAEAPVVIVVVNPLGLDLRAPLCPERRIYELCNAQSAGAALENMSLAAAALGLGSLWICDTYFAHDALKAWLCTKGEPLAALALGHPAEHPARRPRHSLAELTEWRE